MPRRQGTGPVPAHLRNPTKRRHGRGTRLYRASKLDCDICRLKVQCCPNALARKIPRDLDEDARDVARAHAATPEYVEACRRRKKVEMLFAHLKRILRLTRLRLRGPNGARDEFLLAATAQNLRRLARLRPINMLPDAAAQTGDGCLRAAQVTLSNFPVALRSSPSEAILDGFFNGIRRQQSQAKRRKGLFAA